MLLHFMLKQGVFMKNDNTEMYELSTDDIETVSGAGWGGIIGGWGFGLAMNALGHAANNGGMALIEQHNMSLATNRL